MEPSTTSGFVCVCCGDFGVVSMGGVGCGVGVCVRVDCMLVVVDGGLVKLLDLGSMCGGTGSWRGCPGLACVDGVSVLVGGVLLPLLLSWVEALGVVLVALGMSFVSIVFFGVGVWCACFRVVGCCVCSCFCVCFVSRLSTVFVSCVSVVGSVFFCCCPSMGVCVCVFSWLVLVFGCLLRRLVDRRGLV